MSDKELTGVQLEIYDALEDIQKQLLSGGYGSKELDEENMRLDLFWVLRTYCNW